MDTLTSFIAGITVFSVLGYLSVQTDPPLAIGDVLGSGGTAIAFISYPTAIAQFPVPQVTEYRYVRRLNEISKTVFLNLVSQLFAVLFFLMLFTLGIGSATADAGAVISLFADRYPNFPRWKITTALCATSFLVGLVYVTPVSIY